MMASGYKVLSITPQLAQARHPICETDRGRQPFQNMPLTEVTRGFFGHLCLVVSTCGILPSPKVSLAIVGRHEVMEIQTCKCSTFLIHSSRQQKEIL